MKVATKNGGGRKAVPMLVHSFPSHSPLAQPHVARSNDGVALRPMSLEEAVKEAAFRDRDVFVFRDHKGQAMVLHRKRDGKMELIEFRNGTKAVSAVLQAGARISSMARKQSEEGSEAAGWTGETRANW